MSSWPTKQPESGESVGGIGARRRTKENIGSGVQEKRGRENRRNFLEFCLTYQLLSVEERPQFVLCGEISQK